MKVGEVKGRREKWIKNNRLPHAKEVKMKLRNEGKKNKGKSKCYVK